MGFFQCFRGGSGPKLSNCSRSLITSARVQNLDTCTSTSCTADHRSSDHDHQDNKRYRWEQIEGLTQNFSQVIGIGGFSTVYLAHFPPAPPKQQWKKMKKMAEADDPHHHHSWLGAVKVYNSSERLNQVVKSELDISRQLSHPNIVKLLGYSDDRDEGVLVFEYISNGTLQEKLHDPPPTSTCLPWKTRIQIAFQLAQALEYLHDTSNLNIVHGDIKASNILLDQQFNCKLCDFGFAKMGFTSMVSPPSSSSSSSSSSSRMKMMMGSPGYIDPHYLMTGMVSKKSDIYSFGVVVLELVTGIEAFSAKKERMLTSLVRRNSSNSLDMNKVLEMVDGRLSNGGGEFDMDEVKALISIAAVCLHHLPSLRPSASDICQAMRDNISSISFDDFGEILVR